MPRTLVVIPCDDPFMIAGSDHLDRLREVAEVIVFDDTPRDVEEQICRVEAADCVINSRGHLKWPADVLKQVPQLRMITTCSIGVDSIDLDAAAALGVTVSNVPGRTAQIVAEHALALMLGVARRLAFTTAAVRNGQWVTPDNTVLRGKTLGVIGTGAIGREMIALGKAIGMQVQAWTFNPTAERSRQLGVPFVAFDRLLATSDVVSLHVKLTPDSRRLLGAEQFAQMKRGSLLVNTARGPIVDTRALADALHSGQLGGAAIDVFDQEPITPDNPLLDCEHVVLTPHTADQNADGRDLLNSGAVENVLAFLQGTPQNVVNQPHGGA